MQSIFHLKCNFDPNREVYVIMSTYGKEEREIDVLTPFELKTRVAAMNLPRNMNDAVLAHLDNQIKQRLQKMY